MNLYRVCCGNCKDADKCCAQHSCCVECHFSFEESHALRFLPAELAEKIRADHQRIASLGFPRGEIDRHSRWEEAIFIRYCPPAVLQQVLDDHKAYERGELDLMPRRQQAISVGDEVACDIHYMRRQAAD